MQHIPQAHPSSQEVFFQFLLDPDSKYSGLLSDGHLVNAPKFKPEFNRSEFFDLLQDPVVLNYDAFVKRWPWFKDSTFDVSVLHYPDTDSRPGNPHNIAQVFIALVLQQSLLAVIDDGSLLIRHLTIPDDPLDQPPHLQLVPKEKTAPLQVTKPGTPPLDVLDKIYARNPFPAVLVINASLFRFSWCGSSKYLLNWHEKEHRDSRWVHQGIKALAKINGYEDKQVQRALAWLDYYNFIYLIHQGWKGEGNSEYELPKDMSTVEVFRRKKAIKTIRKIGRQKKPFLFGGH
ncbi:hypothetical protein ES703_38708 [subsurface metagenome]